MPLVAVTPLMSPRMLVPPRVKAVIFVLSNELMRIDSLKLT